MKTLQNIFAIAAITVASTFSLNAQGVNIEKSTLKWTGNKVGGSHWGYINLKSANLVVNDGQIKSGEFVIDMKSIVNKDLESAEWNAKLVGHLKSDDFFGVENHPTAKLVITKSDKFSGKTASVMGDLTIKGKTHPITFQTVKEGGNYTAKIVVDRSKYDVRYGSTSFFDNLGDKAIDDDFILEVTLVVE